MRRQFRSLTTALGPDSLFQRSDPGRGSQPLVTYLLFSSCPLFRAGW
jgi:hypothetical protein